MIPSFLIHYAGLSERLQPAISALQPVASGIHVVTHCDGNALSSFQDYSDYIAAWRERLSLIKNILLANTLSGPEPLRHRLYLDADSDSIPSPSWMAPRMLTLGEQSVLLKHYYAICSIANGKDDFGLICEDDVLGHDQTVVYFEEILSFLVGNHGHYCDLAGGCGLEPTSVELESTTSSFLAKLLTPRTRTNAAYVVSKDLACLLASRFFPICFPVDWHLQYLFVLLQVKECYWATKKPFIHGSEVGFYSSWRI